MPAQAIRHQPAAAPISVTSWLLEQYGRQISSGGLTVCEILFAVQENGIAEIGGDDLAERAEVTLPGLRYIVRRLVDLGLVEVETGRGRGQKNRYHLLFLESVVSRKNTFQKADFPERTLTVLPGRGGSEGPAGAVNGKSTFPFSGGDLRVKPEEKSLPSIELLLLSDNSKSEITKATSRQITAWRKESPDLEECYQELKAWAVKQPTLGQAMGILACHPAPLQAVEAISGYATAHMEKKPYVQSWVIRRILDLADDPDAWQEFAPSDAQPETEQEKHGRRWAEMRGWLFEPLGRQLSAVNAYCAKIIKVSETTYQAILKLAGEYRFGGDIPPDFTARLDALIEGGA